MNYREVSGKFQRSFRQVSGKGREKGKARLFAVSRHSSRLCSQVQAEIKKAHFRRLLALDLGQQARPGSCCCAGRGSRAPQSCSRSPAGRGAGGTRGLLLPARPRLPGHGPGASDQLLPCPGQELSHKPRGETTVDLTDLTQCHPEPNKELETML